jgi:hypothetical protein
MYEHGAMSQKAVTFFPVTMLTRDLQRIVILSLTNSVHNLTPYSFKAQFNFHFSLPTVSSQHCDTARNASQSHFPIFTLRIYSFCRLKIQTGTQGWTLNLQIFATKVRHSPVFCSTQSILHFLKTDFLHHGLSFLLRANFILNNFFCTFFPW